MACACKFMMQRQCVCECVFLPKCGYETNYPSPTLFLTPLVKHKPISSRERKLQFASQWRCTKFVGSADSKMIVCVLILYRKICLRASLQCLPASVVGK